MSYSERNYKTLTKAIGILSDIYNNLALPIHSNFAYDLLAEEDGNILKLKILHTECKAPSGAFVVNLRSFGGYHKGKENKKPFDSSMCDSLFVECPSGFYLIPTKVIDNKRAISLSQFEEYKLFRVSSVVEQ